MAFKMMLIFLFGTLVCGGVLKKCENDGDCPTENLFCYTKTGTCAPCVDCAAYRRKHGTTGVCVKDPSQCGDCLVGFQSEVLTDGRTRDLCIPSSSPFFMSTAAPQTVSQAGIGIYWTPVAVVFALMVSVVIVLSFLAKRCIRENMKVQIRTLYHPSPDSKNASSPVPSAPSAPPHFNAACSEEFDFYQQFRCGIKEEEVLNCASKFLDPTYVKSPNPPNPPPVNGAYQDAVDGPVTADNESYLIDESTMPSTWTPGPGYSADTQLAGPLPGPLLTSFEGVLRLNAATINSNSSNNGQSANHSASGQDSNPGQPFNVTNITVINTNSNCSTGVYNITTT